METQPPVAVTGHRPQATGPYSSLGLWATLLGVLLAAAPAMYPGYWESREGFAPVFNAQFPNPVAPIATVPDLWRGTGSATFLSVRPLLAAGMDPVMAVRILFMLAFLAGGLSVYGWLRNFSGDRSAGLAALLYVVLPPFLATAYIRGSAADTLVLTLLPLALAGISHYASGRNPASIGVAVIAILWIWRTQAGLAVFASAALILYTLCVERDSLSVIAVTVSSMAGGFSLLSLRDISGPAPESFAAHFVSLFQFLALGRQDGYPFQLGFVPVIFGLLAIWLWLRGRQTSVTNAAQHHRPQQFDRYDRLLIFCGGFVLLGLLLSTRGSDLLWQFTNGDRLLTYPWQVLLPALPFLAALSGSLPTLVSPLARYDYWGVLAGLVLLSSSPYLTAKFTAYTPPEAPVAVFGANADLVLLEAHLTETTDQAIMKAVWQPLHPLPFDYHIFLQALTSEDGAAYEIRAQLDQQPLLNSPATAWQPGQIFTNTYTLDLPVPPAQANLRYYFGFYNWQDGRRLPLQNGRDDKVVLYGD